MRGYNIFVLHQVLSFFFILIAESIINIFVIRICLQLLKMHIVY